MLLLSALPEVWYWLKLVSLLAVLLFVSMIFVCLFARLGSASTKLPEAGTPKKENGDASH